MFNKKKININYFKRNPPLIAGLSILLMFLLFWLYFFLIIDPNHAKPLSFRPSQSPSSIHIFGTDRLGKDVLTSIIIGTPQTLQIGIIAGTIGVVLGMIFGFISGYYGSYIDYIIKFIVDIFQSIPPLVILVIIAISIPGDMTIMQLSLIVGITSWLGPTRVFRSQVLVIKELNYVVLAKFSGINSIKIIFYEILPNLMPYIMANFVMSVAGAILASIGIEALGLGAFSSNSLGMTIYWNIWYSSLLQGWWWWWLPPIIIIILLFVSLYLISQGLDEWANPRLRTKI